MFASILKMIVGSKNERYLKSLTPTVDTINSLEPSVQKLDQGQLQTRMAELMQEAANGRALDEMLPEVFAMVRETGKRALDMRHFDVQLIGGMVLHQGRIAEMKTGEGKTLVATLPVVLNALSGKGVHLITVNVESHAGFHRWNTACSPRFEAAAPAALARAGRLCVGVFANDFAICERPTGRVLQ